MSRGFTGGVLLGSLLRTLTECLTVLSNGFRDGFKYHAFSQNH